MDAALPRQAFSEHIRELRSRLLWVAATLALAAGIAYQYHTILQNALLSPLHQPVFYTSPTGGLSFVLKISLYFGIMVCVPVLIYHMVRFLEPLMPPHKKRHVVWLTSVSGVLLLGGVAFAYVVALPVALHFFGTFSTSQIRSLISTNEYLSFTLVYLVGFGVIFQLPLVLLIINRITPLRPGKMLRALRYVIVGSLILAAVLTPTLDLVNQTLLAAPVVLLYLISVLFVWMVNRKGTIPLDESALWEEMTQETGPDMGLLPGRTADHSRSRSQQPDPQEAAVRGKKNVLDLRKRE